MRRVTSSDLVISPRELNLLVDLVATLDPDNFPDPASKALIHKCKADIADPHNTIMVMRR